LEGRLTARQIGQAATLEGLGMAIAMTFAAICLKPTRLRRIATGAILAALGANLITTQVSGYQIVLARGLSGLCSGLLLWLLVGLMARGAIPGRLFAFYITTQASGTFLLSWTFTAIVVPRIGVAGGYATIAGIDLALMLAVLYMPRMYAAAAANVAMAFFAASFCFTLLGCSGRSARVSLKINEG
jgi:DHA1 family inner membrane transport protein